MFVRVCERLRAHVCNAAHDKKKNDLTKNDQWTTTTANKERAQQRDGWMDQRSNESSDSDGQTENDIVKFTFQLSFQLSLLSISLFLSLTHTYTN